MKSKRKRKKNAKKGKKKQKPSIKDGLKKIEKTRNPKIPKENTKMVNPEFLRN